MGSCNHERQYQKVIIEILWLFRAIPLNNQYESFHFVRQFNRDSDRLYLSSSKCPSGKCSRSFCTRIHFLLTWEQFLKHSVTILFASIFSSGRQERVLNAEHLGRKEAWAQVIIVQSAWKSFHFSSKISEYPCTFRKSQRGKLVIGGHWAHIPLQEQIKSTSMCGASLTENKLDISRKMLPKPESVKGPMESGRKEGSGWGSTRKGTQRGISWAWRSEPQIGHCKPVVWHQEDKFL